MRPPLTFVHTLMLIIIMTFWALRGIINWLIRVIKNKMTTP